MLRPWTEQPNALAPYIYLKIKGLTYDEETGGCRITR